MPGQERISALALAQKKGTGERIVAVTAYDYQLARLVDGTVDMVLVGDSLGMVFQGHDSTLPVTLDHVVYHTAAVSRAIAKSHLVADMPFLSYQVSDEDALRTAGRLIVEGGAQSVKLEGGKPYTSAVRKMVNAGIPVIGHLGLQPQSVNAVGGYRLQGKTEESRRMILEDAEALVEAGVYAIVLEMVPEDLAAEITRRLPVLTIGIGAGAQCDGQILVTPDLLGMDERFKPRFVKRYSDLGNTIRQAVSAYAKDVRAGTFPSKEQSF